MEGIVDTTLVMHSSRSLDLGAWNHHDGVQSRRNQYRECRRVSSMSQDDYSRFNSHGRELHVMRN